MNTYLEPDQVMDVVRSFLDAYDDESLRDLIIELGAELLDVSPDKLCEML